MTILAALAAAAAFAATYHPAAFAGLEARFLKSGAVVAFRWTMLASACLAVAAFLMRGRIIAGLAGLLADYRAVSAEAELRALPPPEAPAAVRLTLWIALSLVAASMIAVSLLDQGLYRRLIDEDGVFEMSSAAAWLAGTSAAIAAALKARRRGGAPVWPYLPLIGFMFVCFGEEISWGQRIIGFAGPEGLVSMNKQGEVNLHNIGSISVYSNALLLATLCYFLFLPIWTVKRPGPRAYLAKYGFPIPDLAVARIYGTALAAWLIVGLRFGTFGFSSFTLWGYYNQMDDELMEFFMAFAFMAFAVLDFVADWRRAPSPHRQEPVGSARR